MKNLLKYPYGHTFVKHAFMGIRGSMVTVDPYPSSMDQLNVARNMLTAAEAANSRISMESGKIFLSYRIKMILIIAPANST